MVELSNVLNLIGGGWGLVACVMTALFLVSLKKGEADIVDVGWSGCIGILAIWYQIQLPLSVNSLVIAACCVIWSWRLTRYLYKTRFLAAGEDGRYANLRASWGKKANINFFIFFQLQAALALFFSIPVLVAAYINSTTSVSSINLIAGVVIFSLAIVGESVSDHHLSRFRDDPSNKGKVCRVGLWRYSRHPNYFFEWLHWWSYVAFAFGGPLWWLSLLGPALLYYLIMYVTGIPPTEHRAVQSRGDAYREYQRTTSPFFPWFPKE